MKRKPFSSGGRSRWEITDRMFFSLFLTGAIVQFSATGAAFFDGLIISRYLGSNAMAAQGIASPVFTVLSVFSAVMATGMQGKCSQAIGRGNREEFCRFVSAVVYTGTIVSLIVTVFFWFLCGLLPLYWGRPAMRPICSNRLQNIFSLSLSALCQ